MKNISKSAKLSQAVTVTAGAAGTTTINGAALDMAGFESVIIAVTMGAITATAVTSIKVQHGDAANLSDAADLAGTSQTIADSDDEKTYFIEVVKPVKRYLRLVVLRGTANAVVADALYLQFGARKQPTTHGSNVAGETHISPAAGTA